MTPHPQMAHRLICNNIADNNNGHYVLVILQRALRAHLNPALDAAIYHAKEVNCGVVLYYELDMCHPAMSKRTAYFALGAFSELARDLEKSNITLIQHIRSVDEDATLHHIMASARAVYYDADYTHYDRAATQRIQTASTQYCCAVDASRLVPLSALSNNLSSTPAFRKASSALREHYADYQSLTINDIKPVTGIDMSFYHYTNISDIDIRHMLDCLSFNHDIAIAENHLPRQTEMKTRLQRLREHILAKYKWTRNNPALQYSTSELSPYLHFGMLSPFELWNAITDCNIPKSYTWKFRDEAFTWREWSHYQAYYNPHFHCYNTLPKWALDTLENHKEDTRTELLPDCDIVAGHTPDIVFNAAVREWVRTGWLHNNLRMYWSKQILRFTPSPEHAWKLACHINDVYSLDGRDPATYASMRWAFGEARKAYSERPIYGWIAPKSSAALLKRSGMTEWIEQRND